MRKLFFLGIVFFISCSDDNQLNRLNSFLNFESELTQQFFVPSDSIINIQGKKGTKIAFKLNDLKGILNNSKEIDSLQVNLVELTTKQELLYANAQTISNEKRLISDGAFKVEILASGERLSLKENRTISVQLPKTSNEENMQLFYGERDALKNMDWINSEIKLNEKKYLSLHYYLETIIDEELSSRYGGVTTYDELYAIDTLGILSLQEYKNRLPEIDSIYLNNNELSNLKTWGSYEEFMANRAQSQLITNDFYETISISKLGWINIDKFAPEEEKINVTLKTNENVNTLKTYIVDLKNNTILSVFEKEINIPKDRSFLIIAYGIKENSFFGYKKSIRFSQSTEHEIKLREIKKKQLKSMLKLN